ncbi:MAG: InlB B-repeat-containing protein, partial [Clostridia bacterium]|nr:InlB B-repeat-containing protein [Clostridia bacterium]
PHGNITVSGTDSHVIIVTPFFVPGVVDNRPIDPAGNFILTGPADSVRTIGGLGNDEISINLTVPIEIVSAKAILADEREIPAVYNETTGKFDLTLHTGDVMLRFEATLNGEVTLNGTPQTTIYGDPHGYITVSPTYSNVIIITPIGSKGEIEPAGIFTLTAPADAVQTIGGLGNTEISITLTVPETYTVTYDKNNEVNGEVPTDSNEYLADATVTVLGQATLEDPDGYTFGGWNTQADGLGTHYDESDTFAITGDITLYAEWVEIVTYSVTYEEGSVYTGDPAVDLTEVTELPDPLPVLTEEGYAFDGWFTDIELTTSAVAGATITANTTLYAKWTVVEYTIDYYVDGGTTPAENPATYTIETETITLVDSVKDGYIFEGWFINEEGDAITEIEIGSIGSLELYALWTAEEYTITYNLNGGVNGVGNPATYTIETETITLAVPTRTGYTFEGWYDNEEFNREPITEIALSSTEDVVLYAAWEAIEYTITYNLNGGTNGAGNPETYTIETADITLAVPTKTGYTFGGWYDNADFEDSAIVEIELGSTGNVTLYAMWTQAITLIIDGEEEAENIIVGNEFTFVSSLTAAKTGYTLSGWLYNDEVVDEDTVFDYEEEIELTAQFEANDYVVTFDVDGGDDLDEETADVTFDGAIGELPTPVKEGYRFLGWYYGETEVTAETLYEFPEDITLTAVWEEAGFDWITLSYVVSGAIVLILILTILFVAADTKHKKKIR